MSKEDMTTEQIKEKTELRVYHTMERLRYDFNQFIRSDFLQDKYNAKVKPYQEIYIPNVYRMIFTLDDKHKIVGRRPDKIFIDEMVDSEAREYLETIAK